MYHNSIQFISIEPLKIKIGRRKKATLILHLCKQFKTDITLQENLERRSPDSKFL